MGMRIKLVVLIVLVGLLTGIGHAAAQAVPSEQVIVYVFRGEGCPYCHAAMNFLTELKTSYPQLIVRDYEIYYNEENRTYLRQMAAHYGMEAGGVPVIFIGSKHWVGFAESVAVQIEAAIAGCLENTCADPGAGIIPGIEPVVVESAVESGLISPDDHTLALPLLGTVDLDSLSLGVSTGLIALVDGFNPCSLWVLSLLLALVIHSGSRRKTAIVGLTFLTVTSVVYILFIVGLFSIFSFVGFIGWIQVAVALLALAFALINIKDYFWYKEGISLTIADKHKPKIYRDMRGLLSTEMSTPALIGATAVMAAGVTLVELPCTSGLPVLWTNLISTHQVTIPAFIGLLALYMVIFLADELIVFGSVVYTLKASRFEEKQGRLLKLIGGMVMLVLAIVLLIDPSLMNSLTNSLLIFGTALFVAFVILMLHRRILPHYGIYIGTEMLPDRPRRRQRHHARH
jgi:glutaredoxin